MKGIFRIFTRKVFWCCNIIAAVLLLCTKLIPIVSAADYKIMGILGLATPIIAGVNIFFIALWLVFKKWGKSLLSAACIILSWNVFSVGLAGNIGHNNVPDSSAKSFTILSYNVRLFDLYKWSETADSRTKMIGYLHKKNADILCLQEFYSSDEDTIGIRNAKVIAKTMGYNYQARNINFQTKRGFFGDIIFSKYPIVNGESFNLDTSLLTHKFQYADIAMPNNDTVRIFNLHLQSVKFNANDYDLLETKDNVPSNNNLKQGKVIIKKLTLSFANRCRQANIVQAQIKKSPYPTIVCGDFNDLPSSYTYFKVRNNLNDAFLDKGFGLGRTYTGISPLLRIDYLLYDAKLINLYAFKKDNVEYSDHFPLKAWFSIKSKK